MINLRDLPQYFRNRIAVLPLSGCWYWTGALRNGYSCAFVGYKSGKRGKSYQAAITRLAHRVIYELAIGRSLKRVEEDCDHQCPNKRCVNPQHIRILDRSSHIKRHTAERFSTLDREAAKARNRAKTLEWHAAHPERLRANAKRFEAKRQEAKRLARATARQAYPDLPFYHPKRYAVFEREYRRIMDKTRRYPKPAKSPKRIPKTADFSAWPAKGPDGYVS